MAQPFTVDVELAGNVTVSHVPRVAWLPEAEARGAQKVLAGSEPTANGSRDLFICRAGRGSTTHPGKIVAGNCNYTFAGKEYEARSFELLSLPPDSYTWQNRADFEGKNYNTKVRDGQSPAVIAGQESRDDRYGGQLLVCRAKYRDGWHPGKVVINDCMIGYGGKEVQIGDYQVLVRKSLDPVRTTVAIADVLTREQRSLTIEGTFKGAKAAFAQIVTSNERPVDAWMCPDGLAPLAPEPVGADPNAPVQVTRQPAATVSGPRPLSPVAGGGDTAASVPVTPTEPALSGTVQTNLPLVDGERRPGHALRVLKLEKPLAYGADVLAVQRALTRAGWPVREDGVYGAYTARGVALFQTANGLHADGIVGPRTGRRLGF